MSTTAKRTLWLVWVVLTLAIVGYLGAAMLSEGAATQPLLAPARAFLLPGATTHGHHQIELACESCHASPFGGKEVLQEACVSCHGAELKEAEDKHPLTKFLDPRNAELTSIIDATQCVTCHQEHRPEITTAMGITVPTDFCAHCHRDIAGERPSHAGMTFDTCGNAGCHNYHDNRALYEDFLLRRAEDPAIKVSATLPTRDWREIGTMLPDYPSDRYPLKPLDREQMDASNGLAPPHIVDDWLASAHAQAGVNCSGCHEPQLDGEKSAWISKPVEQACRTCHALEVDGFLAGKHGMRRAAALPPMTPAQARLPMQSQVAHAELGCASCHTAHRFDTRAAAADACLGCHADEHSLAYRHSPHGRLWQRELDGGASGSGVSCASCHMPRIEHRDNTFDMKWMRVQHNQNDTLRPNDKMLRPVCLHCHGLGFAINALADPALIRNNFSGAPAVHVRSIDMAIERDRQHRRRAPSAAHQPND